MPRGGSGLEYAIYPRCDGLSLGRALGISIVPAHPFSRGARLMIPMCGAPLISAFFDGLLPSFLGVGLDNFLSLFTGIAIGLPSDGENHSCEQCDEQCDEQSW